MALLNSSAEPLENFRGVSKLSPRNHEFFYFEIPGRVTLEFPRGKCRFTVAEFQGPLDYL